MINKNKKINSQIRPGCKADSSFTIQQCSLVGDTEVYKTLPYVLKKKWCSKKCCKTAADLAFRWKTNVIMLYGVKQWEADTAAQ